MHRQPPQLLQVPHPLWLQELLRPGQPLSLLARAPRLRLRQAARRRGQRSLPVQLRRLALQHPAELSDSCSMLADGGGKVACSRKHSRRRRQRRHAHNR